MQFDFGDSISFIQEGSFPESFQGKYHFSNQPMEQEQRPDSELISMEYVGQNTARPVSIPWNESMQGSKQMKALKLSKNGQKWNQALKAYERKINKKEKLNKSRSGAGRKIRNQDLEKFVLNFVRTEIIQNSKFNFSDPRFRKYT